MKIDELPGQWVWVDKGMALLFKSDPSRIAVRHYRVVRIEGVEPASGSTPATAIWSDADGSYGVEAERLLGNVMNIAVPPGASLLERLAEAVARRINRFRGASR